MKNENTNFQKEKELLSVLLNTCSDARRCYLKYEVFCNMRINNIHLLKRSLYDNFIIR